MNSGDDLTKRVALVETLHPNKEKKLLEKKNYPKEYEVKIIIDKVI